MTEKINDNTLIINEIDYNEKIHITPLVSIIILIGIVLFAWLVTPNNIIITSLLLFATLFIIDMFFNKQRINNLIDIKIEEDFVVFHKNKFVNDCNIYETFKIENKKLKYCLYDEQRKQLSLKCDYIKHVYMEDEFGNKFYIVDKNQYKDETTKYFEIDNIEFVKLNKEIKNQTNNEITIQRVIHKNINDAVEKSSKDENNGMIRLNWSKVFDYVAEVDGTIGYIVDNELILTKGVHKVNFALEHYVDYGKSADKSLSWAWDESIELEIDDEPIVFMLKREYDINTEEKMVVEVPKRRVR